MDQKILADPHLFGRKLCITRDNDVNIYVVLSAPDSPISPIEIFVRKLEQMLTVLLHMTVFFFVISTKIRNFHSVQLTTTEVFTFVE